MTKDLPRYDMPLLLGSVRAITRTATAVAHRGRRFLLTTASGVIYSTEVRRGRSPCAPPSAHASLRRGKHWWPALGLLDFIIGTRSKCILQIKVRVPGVDHAYAARVEHLCMEADLALLSVAAPPSGSGSAAAAAAGRPGRRLGRAGGGRAARQPRGAAAAAGTPQVPAFWRAVRPVELEPALPHPQDVVQVCECASGGTPLLRRV